MALGYDGTEMILAESGGIRALYSSDQSVLLDFGNGPDADVRRRIAAAVRNLSSAPVTGLVNLHPAYRSILAVLDPVVLSPYSAAEQLLDRLSAPGTSPGETLPRRRVEIPVRYGGGDGPDLDWVAAHHRVAPAEIVARHSSVDYEVCFLGFAPGFAYLAGLPASLATPRLDSPRKLVPAGSVGIAGTQTGVYPAPSPGGWRLIGRTETVLFDPRRNPMSLLSPGDLVRFVPE